MQRHQLGHHRLHQRGRGPVQHVDQALHVIGAKQLAGMGIEHLAQMRGDDAVGLDDDMVVGLGLGLLLGQDPDRIEAEGRVLDVDAAQLAHRGAAGQRQLAVGVDGVLGHDRLPDADAIGVGGKVQVVAHPHGGHDEAHGLGHLAPDAGDPRHQRAALGLVDQRDQAIADLDRDAGVIGDILGGDDGRAVLGLARRGRQRGTLAPRAGQRGLAARTRRALRVVLVRDAAERPARGPRRRGEAEEQERGHPRHKADDRQHRGNRHPGARQADLLADMAREIRVRGHAGDDDRRGDGQEQRRDLRHQAVADGQQNVGFRRRAEGQAELAGADDDAADDIGREDQDTGDRIALHELGGTVHRAVEIRLLGDLGAAGAGLLGGQVARVQIGVDGHLLARHRIEREARRHLRDAACTLGDHDKVDDHEDDEDHDPHREIPRDDEGAEGFDHLPGRTGAGVALGQDDPGRGHVERQPEGRGDQQEAGEAGEIQRAETVQRHHQDQQRQQDVEDEEDVQQHHRQRQHHHRHQRKDAHRQQRAADLTGQTEASGQGGVGRAGHLGGTLWWDRLSAGGVASVVQTACQTPRAAHGFLPTARARMARRLQPVARPMSARNRRRP